MKRARKSTSPAPAKGRDKQRTREEILTAARRAFATHGYAQTGVREIAAAAGINSALVVRYFGGKQKLFLAAIDADMALTPFLAGARAETGRHIVDYLAHKPEHDTDSFAILLLGATDPSLSPALKRLIKQRLYDPLVAWLGGRDATARAALLLALVSGVWMHRRLLPVPPLVGGMDRAAMATLADMIQALVDGPA
jgi:AcrR family transcriptional regulator